MGAIVSAVAGLVPNAIQGLVGGIGGFAKGCASGDPSQIIGGLIQALTLGRAGGQTDGSAAPANSANSLMDGALSMFGGNEDEGDPSMSNMLGM